jgi:hypothetical protein
MFDQNFSSGSFLGLSRSQGRVRAQPEAVFVAKKTAKETLSGGSVTIGIINAQSA